MRMMMIALSVALCGGSVAKAQCRGGYCQRPPGRVLHYRPAPTVGTVPVYYVAANPAPAVAYQPSPPPPSNEAGAFLSALNSWRAQHGRGPVGWDATLAAYAATNSWAGHQPGSTGGAAQCWASHRSLLGALAAWQRSPAHAAILLNARVAVGASLCPSGSTCNAR